MAQLLDKAKNFVAEKLADVKKPEATLEDVDLKNVSRECVEYTAKVNVDNPYSHSLPICEISYTFKSAGRFLQFFSTHHLHFISSLSLRGYEIC